MTERKALIFDFDGLIVDTEAAEMLAWKKEFARHGLDFDMAKYINTIGSNGPEARYEADLLAACPDETRSHDQIWADHTRHSIEEGLKLPPLPGVLELIDQALHEVDLLSAQIALLVQLIHLALAQGFAVVGDRFEASGEPVFLQHRHGDGDDRRKDGHTSQN